MDTNNSKAETFKAINNNLRFKLRKKVKKEKEKDVNHIEEKEKNYITTMTANNNNSNNSIPPLFNVSSSSPHTSLPPSLGDMSCVPYDEDDILNDVNNNSVNINNSMHNHSNNSNEEQHEQKVKAPSAFPSLSKNKNNFKDEESNLSENNSILETGETDLFSSYSCNNSNNFYNNSTHPEEKKHTYNCPPSPSPEESPEKIHTPCPPPKEEISQNGKEDPTEKEKKQKEEKEKNNTNITVNNNNNNIDSSSTAQNKNNELYLSKLFTKACMYAQDINRSSPLLRRVTSASQVVIAPICRKLCPVVQPVIFQCVEKLENTVCTCVVCTHSYVQKGKDMYNKTQQLVDSYIDWKYIKCNGVADSEEALAIACDVWVKFHSSSGGNASVREFQEELKSRLEKNIKKRLKVYPTLKPGTATSLLQKMMCMVFGCVESVVAKADMFSDFVLPSRFEDGGGNKNSRRSKKKENKNNLEDAKETESLSAHRNITQLFVRLVSIPANLCQSILKGLMECVCSAEMQQNVKEYISRSASNSPRINAIKAFTQGRDLHDLWGKTKLRVNRVIQNVSKFEENRRDALRVAMRNTLYGFKDSMQDVGSRCGRAFPNKRDIKAAANRVRNALKQLMASLPEGHKRTLVDIYDKVFNTVRNVVGEGTSDALVHFFTQSLLIQWMNNDDSDSYNNNNNNVNNNHVIRSNNNNNNNNNISETHSENFSEQDINEYSKDNNNYNVSNNNTTNNNNSISNSNISNNKDKNSSNYNNTCVIEECHDCDTHDCNSEPQEAKI